MEDYAAVTMDLDAWQPHRPWPPAPDRIGAARSILEAVSRQYGISIARLLDKRRQQHVVVVRNIAIYLIRTSTGLSFPKLGELMHRDHSTIIHSCHVIARMMAERPGFGLRVEQTRKLSGRGAWEPPRAVLGVEGRQVPTPPFGEA